LICVSRPAGVSVGRCKIAATSKCARKKSGSALRKTTTVRSGSAFNACESASSSASRASVMTLTGGLLIVTVATRPETATSRSLYS
jgi:hypothetical protein